MKRFWILKGLKVLVLVALAAMALAYIVTSLWNWLIPSITGLHAITYTQGLALLVLCRVLFGSLRGGGCHGQWGWRHRMHQRWTQMSPEERERFRDLMQSQHWCGSGHAAEPSATKS